MAASLVRGLCVHVSERHNPIDTAARSPPHHARRPRRRQAGGASGLRGWCLSKAQGGTSGACPLDQTHSITQALARWRGSPPSVRIPDEYPIISGLPTPRRPCANALEGGSEEETLCLGSSFPRDGALRRAPSRGKEEPKQSVSSSEPPSSALAHGRRGVGSPEMIGYSSGIRTDGGDPRHLARAWVILCVWSSGQAPDVPPCAFERHQPLKPEAPPACLRRGLRA